MAAIADAPRRLFDRVEDLGVEKELEQRGVDVARDEHGHVLADIEISPLTAMGPETLDPSDLPEAIGPGDRVML